MIEYEHDEDIRDFHGEVLGMLSVALSPCSSSGKEIIGEFLENPYEMVSLNSFPSSLRAVNVINIYQVLIFLFMIFTLNTTVMALFVVFRFYYSYFSDIIYNKSQLKHLNVHIHKLHSLSRNCRIWVS